MDQQTTGLSLDQVLGNPTSPSGAAQPTSNPDMLAEANTALSQGMHPDDAIRSAYEKYPEAQGVSFTLSKDGKTFIDNGVRTKGLSIAEVSGGQAQDKGISLAQVKGDEEHNPETPHTNVSDTLSKTLKWFKEFGENKREDVMQTVGNVRSYFHNYAQEHELTNGGPITTQQKAAAKLLGMDLPDFPIWGPIYKMSPADREALDKKYQESLGLHPDKTSERLAKTTSNKTEDFGEFDPFGNFINDSLVTHLAGMAGSPELGTTKKYHEVQDMMENMDAVEHPEKYTPSFVKFSADKILAYKKMNETGTVQKIKEFAGEIKKNPIGATKGMAGGILSDPELMLAPEAKLGSFAVAGRDVSALGAASSAARMSKLAESVRGAAANLPHIQEAAEKAAKNYEQIGVEATASAKRLKALKHVGDIVGTSGAGASINAATEGASQESQQGYVRKGSLTLAEVTGAAFGGGVHLLGETGAALKGTKGDLETDLKDRSQPKPQEENPNNVKDINANRKPGQPLSPDTPINKEGKVPYYGGVDASGKIIHLDKNTPDEVEMTNRRGQKVPVNVQQTVGYHEAVEFPLMHMEGPIDDETLAELQQRIGPDHKLPPKTIEKLRKGESLVYTNPNHEDTDPGGHEIATWAENHMVHTLYDIDPSHYQESLKPYIKDVGKESQKTGAHKDIPPNLDTKPYDDVGQSEQLKGKGNRPTVDNVEPGAEENTDNKQKGKVDPRLLATGAVTAGGTLAGTLLPGDKEKNALLGGIAGLATSALFWGGDVGVRGPRMKEGGMFVGPNSRTWKGTDTQMAERMEKIGKSPDEITLATGMHRNAAGQWTGEISDKDMSFVSPDHPDWERAKKEAIPLSTVMNHDKLDVAYPGLSDQIKIKIDPTLKSLGRFTPTNDTITLRKPPMDEDTSGISGWTRPGTISEQQSAKSIIAHELQHVIQEIEGFPIGSSSSYQMDKLRVVQKYLENRLDGLYTKLIQAEYRQAPKEELQNLEDQYNRIQDQLMGNYSRAGMEYSSFADYKRQAGEVQARNTQERLGMSEQERYEKSPRTTQDVANEHQLIRFPKEQKGLSNLEPIEKLKDNYRKPLNNYTDSLFHETNVENGVGLLPHSNIHGEVPLLYTSNTPDLATGQGGKTGVLFKLDPSKIEGQINTRKPTWEYSWKNSQAEFTSHGLTNKQVQQAVKEVTFKKGSRASAPAGLKARTNLTINNMVKEGWSRVDHPNGDVTLIRPSYVPKEQRGSVDPETLGRIARAAVLGTVGATIGLRLSPDDDKWQGALAGVGLAVLSGPLLSQFLMHPVDSVKRISTNLKQTVTATPKENISNATSRWQEAGLHQEIAVYRVQKAIQRIVPRKDSRIRITHALDSGNTSSLTPKELTAYKIARQFDDDLGKMGQQAGVLPQLINNHISHIWKNDAKLKAYQQMVNSQIIANMSPTTAFATARQLKSIKQGKAIGLTPVTEDVSEILGIYAKSVMNAIRNKQLLESLKNTKDSTGNTFLVTPVRKAPFNYVPINHPQLRGLSVHPTIAPELRNVFYTYDMGPIQGALSTLNMAIKRSQVSFSAFHLTSLADAYLGGMPTFTQPIKTVGKFVRGVVGKSDWHSFLEGKAGPDITALGNRFLASGAVPQISKGAGRDIDLSGNDYYEGLKQMQEYMDKAMPGLGMVPDIAAKVSHVMDHIIFENGMSSAKFSLWMHAVQKMNEAWAKEARKNPNVQVPAQESIDKMAGGYVNNLLGAQNWLQASNEATTKLGRYYLNALGSPIGRKVSSYLLFAPDWTTSTVMSLTKAFGKGSGLSGLKNPKTVADLHRIYQFRSAMLYAFIGGVINYAYSGHYIWDNKDPTTIDLGNGQRLQWNKHWTEPYQMMIKPMQTIVNKMGNFPREILDQITHKEYINTSGYSPDMKDRLSHLAKNIVPIPFQNIGEQTPQQMMWNLAGRNVLGHPTEDKDWQRQEHARRSAAAKASAEKRAAARLKKLYGG